jgi:hypothetical protein
VAVVAAVELQHHVASGRATREPHGRHRCLGAARDEPDHVEAGERVDESRGQLDLALGRGAEGRPLGGSRGRRRDDLRMRVSEQQRTPRPDQIDVPRPVDVHDVRALAAFVEAGHPTDGAEGAHRRVDPARDHLARVFEQLLGPSHAPDATDAPPSLTAAHPPGTLAG